MKLFKNGVGRPSNETKQLRRVFVVSVAAIIISVVTLFICLLSKSSMLTQNLSGAVSGKVSYGLWNQNENDIKINSYPSYSQHNGTVKFPAAPSYTIKSSKKCSFKGWIFQKLDDGRYRILTKDGKYVWYSSSKDGDKYKMQRYAFFGEVAGTPSYKLNLSINVKLYAAFDCNSSGSSSSSNTSNTTTTKRTTTTKAVTGDNIRIVYLKNASAATGTMSAKDFSRTSLMKLDNNMYLLEGNSFAGWKAYTTGLDGKNKYFVDGKGWTGTKSEAKIMGNGETINKNYEIREFTPAGKTIYLEAQWKEKSGKSGYYTIVFKPNGGSGTMKNQEIKKASSETGGSTNLKGNSFEKSGYTFNGWKAYRIIGGSKKYFVKDSGWVGTSASNSTTIDNKVDIQKNYGENSSYKTYDIDRFTSAGKTIYLEAQWKASAKLWTAKIDKNGGSLKSGKVSTITSTSNGKLPTCSTFLTRSGYTCKGWNLYRTDVTKGKTTYFTMSPKKGWQSTAASDAYLFPNGYSLSNIKDFIGNGKTFYIKAVWQKNTTTTKKTTTTTKKNTTTTKKTTTTTKKTTTGVKSWTVIINKGEGSFKKSNHGITKSSTLTIKSNGSLPSCINYLERSGHTCTGWKLYRDTRNGSKYFVSGKGWTGTYQGGLLFGNGDKISKIYDFTGDGVTIYIKPVWYKK